MTTINFRYDEKKKEELEKKAEKEGFDSLSSYAKFLIESGSGLTNTQPKKKKIKLPSNSPQIKTRVTPDEKIAFLDLCEAEGVTESFAVRRQVLIAINNTAHFSKEELAELRDANFQLKAIGRNLNQIVTQINSGAISDSKLSQHYIEQLKGFVDKQAKAIVRLVQKTKDRVVE